MTDDDEQPKMLPADEALALLANRHNSRETSRLAEESLRRFEEAKAIVDVVRPVDERRSIEYELVAAHEARDWERFGQITRVLALSPVNLKAVMTELITWMVTVSKEQPLEMPLSQFLTGMWLVLDIEEMAGDDSAIHTETIRADEDPDSE